RDTTMLSRITRREVFATVAAIGSGLTLAADKDGLRLATFVAEVTPPLKHPCMGGGIAPVARIDDPLFVHGFVLLGAGKPIVLVAVDWCEIRNDAYERWRQAVAEAVKT